MGANTDRYSELLGVPKALAEEFYRYESNCERIEADYNNTGMNIQEDYENAEAASVQVRETKKREAESRYAGWIEKLGQYRTKSAHTRQSVTEILSQALKVPVQSPSHAVGLLKEQTVQRFSRHKKDDNSYIETLCRKEIEVEEEIQRADTELSNEAQNQKNSELKNAESTYREEHAAHTDKKKKRLHRNTRKYELQKEQEEEEFAERVESLILPEKVRTDFEKMQEEQPNYEKFEPAEEFPDGIQFGYAGYDITEHARDQLENAVISRRFGYAVTESNGRKYLVMPYGYSFKDTRFSTMFEFTASNREDAAESIRNLALNMYMSIPVNKCWCTFIDPVSLGNTFAVFSPMGEKDERGNGDERAIDTRIWSDDKQIEERLKLIVDHTTDVIQRCLQGRYENILDYNKDAGINAEPLRFLMIMDFPKHFTDKSISYLESIIDNGPKTGVYTIIAADKTEMENRGEGSSADRIRRLIKNKVISENNMLCIQESTREGKMRYFPFSSPKSDQIVGIVNEIREHLGEKIVITYPMISDNLPEKPDYWFHKSARDGISVPIGMEGAGKIVNLEFGQRYLSFAAMIGGTTGSGKTYLEHAIIQSVIFNYKPEEVQLFLIDFKEGVGFRPYVDYRLPNIKLIAVDTEPEFGLAVLQELRQEMTRRSQKFKDVRVSDIESYWKYKGERGESCADMPRMLVIFDEIQEFLHNAENEITKKCVGLIRALVTMGVRAYGIHLILSTQSFENVKALDNGIYSNIHTRIALKSSKEAGQILLSSDNEVANRLLQMDEGQGVINNNAGHRDANRTFRAALITDKERDLWMKRVRDKQMEDMVDEPVKPRILLSGPEDDIDNPLTIFETSGMRPFNTGDPSYHLYIGESLTMINTFLPSLLNRHGHNLLIVGRDSEGHGLSRMAIGYCVLSLLYETVRLKGEITAPFITLFDLSGNSLYGNMDFDMLDIIKEMVPQAIRDIPNTMILDEIETLYNELGDGRQQFVVFYGLNRAKRLTTGTYQRSSKEQLEELFARGPENGMNFIVWANDPGMFIENYGAAMNSFDLRLAYGMDDKEFKVITGEAGPGQSSKMNAISCDLDGDNQKVRMYSQPTENWLRQFLENIRNYVR